MPTATFIDCALLLFVLLNPFLLSIYLLDLIQELDRKTFRIALIQGAVISAFAFVVFAFAGDAIFARVLQVRFASFLVFGGIVFLVVAIRYVMVGSEAIRGLRGGSPDHIAGSIAMPFMIGPGTVSASVLAGSRLPFGWAALSIVCALAVTTVCVLVLKWIHDSVKQRYEAYVERYIDIVGRISALIIGTIAVEMILKGIDTWLEKATPQ
jgi:multiple antibiotic resistance protein